MSDKTSVYRARVHVKIIFYVPLKCRKLERPGYLSHEFPKALAAIHSGGMIV